MTSAYYQIGGQGSGNAFPLPVQANRAPTTTDLISADGSYYVPGQGWFNKATGIFYMYQGQGIWDVEAGSPITSVVSNSGTATPSAGVLNIVGTGSITSSASGNTETFALTGLTNHAVLVGAGTATVTKLTVGATGTLLAGATGADPAFTGSPSVSGSLTAGTTVTATSGAITATNGNIVLGTAGNKILSTSVGTTTAAGANSFGSVTLVGGTATVATTAVTSSSLIFLSRQSLGATGANPIGMLSVGTITGATSFVINAATTASATTPVATDVSVVSWMIVN